MITSTKVAFELTMFVYQKYIVFVAIVVMFWLQLVFAKKDKGLMFFGGHHGPSFIDDGKSIMFFGFGKRR